METGNSKLLNVIMLASMVPVAGLMIPLALGRVARNNTYGYRTPRSMADDGSWYRLNRMAGRAGLVFAAFNVTVDALQVGDLVQLSVGTRLMCLGVSLVLLLLFCLVHERMRPE